MLNAVEPSCRVVLKNILVATDFSAASKRGQEYAIAFARRYGSTIHFAHVFNTDPFVIGVPETSAIMCLDPARRDLETMLGRLAEMATRSGIPAEAQLVEGEIGTQIHDLVLKHDIDMVVVGTHGGGALSRLMLGSTAESIFREVPCPVLTVGPKVARHPNREIDFRQILYATDFTPESAQAAPLAISLAEEYGAKVTLFHVLPADLVSDAEVKRHSEYYNDELRKLVPLEAKKWCRPHFLLEGGSAASAIVDFATGNAVDLIVLGAKRGSTMASHFSSGTAYKVICNAESPVVTVRGR